MLPPSVDLPASTCPIKITFTCSLPYTSSSTSLSTAAACSLATASASRCAALLSAGVGLDFPDDRDGDALPLGDAADLSDFSSAFAAVTFAPSSAEGASFGAVSVGADVAPAASPPMDRTFVFGAADSTPTERVFTTGGPEVVAVSASFGTGFELVGVAASPPVGLFRMPGVRTGGFD